MGPLHTHGHRRAREPGWDARLAGRRGDRRALRGRRHRAVRGDARAGRTAGDHRSGADGHRDAARPRGDRGDDRATPAAPGGCRRTRPGASAEAGPRPGGRGAAGNSRRRPAMRSWSATARWTRRPPVPPASPSWASPTGTGAPVWPGDDCYGRPSRVGGVARGHALGGRSPSGDPRRCQGEMPASRPRDGTSQRGRRRRSVVDVIGERHGRAGPPDPRAARADHRQARVPEPGLLEEGPDRPPDHRGRGRIGRAHGRARRSSSSPAATRGPAWRSSARSRATPSSPSCRRGTARSGLA